MNTNTYVASDLCTCSVAHVFQHSHNMYIIIKHIYSTHKDKIKKKCTGEMAYWIKVLLYTPEKPESRSPGHT